MRSKTVEKPIEILKKVDILANDMCQLWCNEEKTSLCIDGPMCTDWIRNARINKTYK